MTSQGLSSREGGSNFNVALSAEDYAALTAIANREERTVVGQVRFFLKQALAKERKRQDREHKL